MAYTTQDILSKLSLARQGDDFDPSSPIVLSGGASDQATKLIVSLKTSVDFDENGLVSDIGVKYWRHLPYGKSREQNLIRISFKPASRSSNKVEVDEMWIQSFPVHQKTDFSKLDVNRVLGAVARVNELLREKGPVEDLAKIFSETRLQDIIGEDVVVRGLNEKGFHYDLGSDFARFATQGAKKGFFFENMDAGNLMAVLGFHQNTLENDKNHMDSRRVLSVDPQSGAEYESGVKFKETKHTVTASIYIKPSDVPEGIDAQAIPDLVTLQFRKKGEGYALSKALFMDRDIDTNDTSSLLRVIGFAQKCNHDVSNWKFPSFGDHMAEYDLLDMINPFPAAPSLEKDGGEFLYGSLHGTGFEKVVENFGDQIGTAALFMHRGVDKDGNTSSVAVAVDFPFASGGPDSGWDGAVPDYLPFWDDIKAFCITHDHFDHCDGLPFYARKGLLKEKTIYATPQVKYFLKEKMNKLDVPSELRPRIIELEEEGAFPLHDDKGNVRLWVQHKPNATLHSALCTPFIVTGCYNDDHYNGSVLVYGDGRGLRADSLDFFSHGARGIADYAADHGKTVTKEKVDYDLTTVLHDITGVQYDGISPEPKEVEENHKVVFDWFSDRGILLAPISTNNAEYTVDINVAAETGRNITAVGSNAELRLTCMNSFGVLPDFNLRDIRIDPFEESEKDPKDRVIPYDILRWYKARMKWAAKAAEKDEKKENAESDMTAEEHEEREQELFEQYMRDYHESWKRDYTEKLSPEDRKHEQDTRLYIMNSLRRYGAVVFENDLNGYLMWKAIMGKQEKATNRATRTSKMAKDFREKPENLMIFITGTQGNSEEHFSTLNKFANFFSLLDADEKLRPTGYKIDSEDYVAVITQPAIPGNEHTQESMIHDLIRNRDITVVAAFVNGFKVYNPKDKRDDILADLNKKGWRYEYDPTDGGIRVYSRPIHIHGHGFQGDLTGIAKSVKADLHECHHVPSEDAYNEFRQLMKRHEFTHSGIKPDNFQFMRVDRNVSSDEDKYKIVARTNPSYILVRMIRKYGQFFGGTMEWSRATMVRREGHRREDGLMARTASDGMYVQRTVQKDWEAITNPDKRSGLSERFRRLGPSSVDRGVDMPRRPRSRPRFSNNRPEVP